MIKIPSTDKKFSQPNNSDLFGNLYYTKSVNLDEEGYVKLSSRTVSIKSEEDDSNFDIPVSFGRYTEGGLYVATTDQPEIVDLLNTSVQVTEDNDGGNDPAPSLNTTTYGRWWQNRWHVTNNTKLYYKTVSSGDWTDASVSLTTGLSHPLEVFRSKVSMCVGNGNTVKLLDTSYSTTVTLTIPSDYEVIGLSYCNQRMGIVTRLSQTAAGQNQEAFFFIWDGVTTAANQGFPVGSDAVIAITAYKSSWVILTRAGEILYFNGGGWEKLCSLPFYYKSQILGDFVNRVGYGDMLLVEGDVLYINIQSILNSSPAPKEERYLENNLGGILCYDPSVGLYHRYSPSVSQANLVTVTSANINTTTDIMTKTAGTLPTTGNPIKYTSDGTNQIGGLLVGKVYYIIKHSSTTFSLAETKTDAIAGNKINLTSTGAANNYFLALNLKDYGISRTARAGGIALMGMTSNVADHLIYGGEYTDTNSTTDYANLCVTVSGFDNRGYIVTPKITSLNIEDYYQKIYLKYKPLKNSDKILVKVKKEDVAGIPVSTSQNTNVNMCTWTDANTFTTTADLSEVESYINDSEGECEVEIIGGAGAGQMAQISSISFAGGTYTVNLDEEMDGISASDTSDVLINNWQKVATLDSSDILEWKKVPLGKHSKFLQFKIELRGDGVTLEELQLINDKHETNI